MTIVLKIVFFSITLFIPNGLSQISPLNSRVLNGEDAQIGQFPWHVGIQSITFDIAIQFCNGALISEDWVLTSATCVNNAIFVGVHAGSTNNLEPDGEYVPTFNYIVHEEFDSVTLRNDIALVNLDPPFPFNENISSVALADEELGTGVAATITGWGHSDNDFLSNQTYTLQFATVLTIDNSVCQAIYGTDVVSPGVVCTSGDDGRAPCYNDGGGPLVVNAASDPALVAIFSFISSLGCEDYPAGYTRIGYYREWIREKTGI